jgi:hypothetical protein
MFDKKKFTVTSQHLLLMKRMYISYNSYCEFGAPEVNPKRPYGNSDVYYDIGEILEITPSGGSEDDPEFTAGQEVEMLKLHKETETALQIAVVTGCFESGEYEADEYSSNWVKI